MVAYQLSCVWWLSVYVFLVYDRSITGLDSSIIVACLILLYHSRGFLMQLHHGCEIQPPTVAPAMVPVYIYMLHA